MNKQEAEALLSKYRAKQKALDEAWARTANHNLMGFFVEITPRLLDVERCSIFVHDPSSRNVWVHCGTGLSRRQVQVPDRSSMVGEVIANKKPQSRKHMEETVGAHGVADMQTGFTTHDSLCVPIFNVKGDQAVGAIQVLNKRGGRDYTADDTKLLEHMAFQIQSQIENIYLRQEILKVSEKMGEQISKLEIALTKANGKNGK